MYSCIEYRQFVEMEDTLSVGNVPAGRMTALCDAAKERDHSHGKPVAACVSVSNCLCAL